MRAEIVTIGDELLIGQTVNTNASWMGDRLGLVGIDVQRVIVVGDSADEIKAAIEAALSRAQLVVVTGGLGPTHDDITRQVVASFFDTELVFDQRLYEAVRQRFTKRGRSVPESNRTQAMVPVGFDLLPNPIGTAPGFWRRHVTDDRIVYLAVVPGVPREMERMLTEQIIPRMLDHEALDCIEHRVIQTTGIGESHLQERLDGVVGELDGTVTLAYLPSLEGVKLRLSARSQDRDRAIQSLDRASRFILQRAGTYIFSVVGESLEEAIGRLVSLSGDTIGLAESCTGGRVLDKLTNIPGASAYVRGGVVAYCDQVKRRTLGVPPEVIASDGAVSEAVARQMARGIRQLIGTTIGVASTGILGPGGGSEEKPVGTVWIALSREGRETSRLLRLGTDRNSNKRRTVAAVLDLIRLDLRERGYSALQ